MTNFLDLWYLTPICILSATLAMTVGIGGPVFLTPLFVLVLELPPATAVAVALFTQLFGFLSGSVAYGSRRLIDFRIARGLLLVVAPAALAGSLISASVSGHLLRQVFGGVALVIAWRVFAGVSALRGDSRQYDPDAHRVEGAVLSSVGALLLGVISVGLAEVQGYHLMVRRRVPAGISVATNIFVVLVAVAAAAVGHVYRLTTTIPPERLGDIIRILVFTVPGVVIGGQLGPVAQTYLSPTATAQVIAVVLVAIGITMMTMGAP